MKKTLVLIYALSFSLVPGRASAQAFDCAPPWAVNVNCQFDGEGGCSSSDACAGGYVRWSEFRCTYTDPYCGDGGCYNSCTGTITQCDTICNPGFIATTAARKAYFGWQAPDPLKFVMGLFPQPQVWRPVGPHGACKLVKRTAS